jgi:hypothetical protein
MEEKVTFRARVKSAWNAFFNKDPTPRFDYGQSYFNRPDRPVLSRRNERTIAAAIYNRIACDVAEVGLKHIKLDENGRFLEEVDSELNRCLNLEANIDQTGRAFMQDVVMSLLDEGVIAIVPIDVDVDLPVIPTNVNADDILSMRVGRITEWYPSDIKVEVYDERDGQKKERIWPKTFVSIVENPFYAVMNERNSTLQRLIRKLYLLDAIDEQSGSGKLDLIVQLPFSVKTETKRLQAEARRKDIEQQLAGSKYGIAYIDASEHVTQLNRGVENNLMSQIEYLTNTLYSQLGITQSILDGTADEQTKLNYYSQTIEPILAALANEMKRKWITQNARTRGESIMFFRDPFKLVPADKLAELADKLTRNEIATSNEIRQIVGMKPSDDPSADELRNKNLSQPAEEGKKVVDKNLESEEIQNGI